MRKRYGGISPPHILQLGEDTRSLRNPRHRDAERIKRLHVDFRRMSLILRLAIDAVVSVRRLGQRAQIVQPDRADMTPPPSIGGFEVRSRRIKSVLTAFHDAATIRSIR